MEKSRHIQSAAKIQIRQISDIDSFAGLRDSWTSLLPKNHTQDVFLTWEWLFTWWKHLEKHLDLWLVTAWISDELVGIAPLMLLKRRKLGIKLRELYSLGFLEIDVGGFIVKDSDPKIFTAICNHLVNQQDRWYILALHEHAISGPEIREVKSYFKQSGFASLQTKSNHYYLPITGDWQTYIQDLPKKIRHELRRKTRRIERTHKSQYIQYVGQEVTSREVFTIFEINGHGHYPHLYQSPEAQSFLRELSQLMAEKG